MIENARMDAIRHFDLLDTEPEAEFESIVQAAAAVCDMPMCLIALLDEHRYWVKANIGMPDLKGMTHDVSFCSRSIECDGLLEIPDCTLNPHVAACAVAHVALRIVHR